MNGGSRGTPRGRPFAWQSAANNATSILLPSWRNYGDMNGTRRPGGSEDAARDEHQVAQAQASRRPATNVRTIGMLLQTADTVAPV